MHKLKLICGCHKKCDGHMSINICFLCSHTKNTWLSLSVVQAGNKVINVALEEKVPCVQEFLMCEWRKKLLKYILMVKDKLLHHL